MYPFSTDTRPKPLKSLTRPPENRGEKFFTPDRAEKFFRPFSAPRKNPTGLFGPVGFLPATRNPRWIIIHLGRAEKFFRSVFTRNGRKVL